MTHRRLLVKLPESSNSNIEVADRGRGGPNKMITLNTLRILMAADRLNARLALPAA